MSSGLSGPMIRDTIGDFVFLIYLFVFFFQEITGENMPNAETSSNIPSLSDSNEESEMTNSQLEEQTKEVPLKLVSATTTDTKSSASESNCSTSMISNATTTRSTLLTSQKPLSSQGSVVVPDTTVQNTPTSSPRSLSPAPKPATSDTLLANVLNANLFSGLVEKSGISKTGSTSSLSSMGEALDNKKARPMLKVNYRQLRLIRHPQNSDFLQKLIEVLN